MRLLQGAIKHYRWGSPTAICELLGTEPSGEPVAELWLGAHRSAPAHVDGVALDAVIAADPEAELGAAVASRYGALPFLLKVLSAADPLSLQTHPSQEQAEAGFAAENAQGIGIDSPRRMFRDRNAKPELICALTEFSALCGLREPAATLGLLDRLHDAAPSSALDELRDRMRRAPDANGLRAVLAWLLNAEKAPMLVTAVRNACEAVGQGRGGQGRGGDPRGMAEHHGLCREVAALAARYPEDPAAAAALLLNLVILQPGDALYLAPGTLHSYLRGTALEVMAGSDNVVRAGLTSKHVDIETLVEIADTRACEPGSVVSAGLETRAGVTSYSVPTHEFRLERIDADRGEAVVRGPAVLLCTSGTAAVTPAPDPTPGQLPAQPSVEALARGQAAWLAASDCPVRLSGRATVFCVGVGGA